MLLRHINYSNYAYDTSTLHMSPITMGKGELKTPKHKKLAKKWNFIGRRTNKKKIGNPDRLPLTQKFQSQLRVDIRSRRRYGSGNPYHPKWGRWLPCKRLNADKVPCPFVLEDNKTHEEEGAKTVWISQANDGLDKTMHSAAMYFTRGRTSSCNF